MMNSAKRHIHSFDLHDAIRDSSFGLASPVLAALELRIKIFPKLGGASRPHTKQ